MNHMMECHYCKKTFRAFRITARFCSDSCRVSYNRLPTTFSTKAGNAWAGMVEVYDLAERFPEKRAEAQKQLDWLQQHLTDLRAKFDAKENSHAPR